MATRNNLRGNQSAPNASPAIQHHQQNHNSSSNHNNSSTETNLAVVLIGIVIMHITCHTLRVFLAGTAVHLIKVSDARILMPEGRVS